MDTKSEDATKSKEAAVSCAVKELAPESESNLKSGKDSDSSKKLSQPLEHAEDSEDDLILCISSDNEALEDSSDAKKVPAKKSTVGVESEKYFSDIESSDNSQEYELKTVEKGAAESENEKKQIDEIKSVEQHKESPKVIELELELELEPVESDEDEFDENVSVKKTEETQLKNDDKSVIEKAASEILTGLEDISDKEEASVLGEEVETISIEAEKDDTKDEEQSMKLKTEEIPEDKRDTPECTLTDKSEEKDDEKPEVVEAEVAKSDPKQETSTLDTNEKEAGASSTELGTGKEDEKQILDAVTLDANKVEAHEEIDTIELTEDAKESESPIAKEAVEKVADGAEKANEKESAEAEGKIVDTKEPSVVEIRESTEDLAEKEDKTDKCEDNASQSTEDVLESTAVSNSQDPSKPSESLEKLDSKSNEEVKETDGDIPTEKIQEPVTLPVEKSISGETDPNVEKSKVSEPKGSETDLEPEKEQSSDKSDLENVDKEDDKPKANKEDVVLVAEKEAKDEAVQEQKNADTEAEATASEGLVVEKEQSDGENKGELKSPETTVEEKEQAIAETKEPENVVDVKEQTETSTKVPTEVLVETKSTESPPQSKDNKTDSEKVETEQKTDQTISTPEVDELATTDDKDSPPPATEDIAEAASIDDGSILGKKLTTKVSELMKTMDSSSLQGLTSDDDESLLVIDTTHKDDNENEDIDMDTETEQTVATASTTDSSSDGSLEIFYHKECSNYDCSHGSKNFYRAPHFALSYYKVSKKRYKPQFVCEDCYDQALHAYEEMCVILKQKQPLYGANIKRQDFVEIIDSSDEEDTASNADNCKDENTFPKESIEFLENELEGIIRNVMQSVEIQNQLSWTKQVLQQSIDRVTEESNYVSDQLQQLQKKADKMHNSLYQCPSIKIRQLTPLDLNSGRSYSPESESTIPAIGEIERPAIQLNETYYAVKNKAIASWVPCKVIEEVEDCTSQAKNLKHFKIKFLKSKYPMLKTLSAKHMAYFDPPKVRLPIGTRVIAYFDASSLSRGKEKMLIPSAFYPGIIAEPLKITNKFRYLVFYDDGYFQYVSYKDVRLVCHASENVWDDVHHQSRDFIQNYLTQYAVNRPMVQTQKNQCMLVDYNGKWVYARVVDVDCSLVQMMFEGQSRSEWIYRGSTRLGPVYKESNNIAPKTSWNQSRISRRTEPFIRYLNDEDSSSSQPHTQPQQHQSKPGEVRSVAKKSVSRSDAAASGGTQPVPVVKHLNNSTIFVDDDNKPKGKVVYYTARKNLPPRDYVPHICGPSCPFVITHNLQFYSPLAKPLLSGWERQVFRQKSKKFIVYRGPCGKRLRTMEELHRYLRVTNNELNVDNFDFSSETNCLAEYVIESCIVQKKDISNGEEKMPIPCVNYYDNTMPPDCKYSSRRIPTEGVHLNLDQNFLVGCDCDDDCSDKSKCSCWQLTYAGAKYSMPNVPHEMVGYQYKRLFAHVPTGIYECNSRCKCKANCVNRVVQQSLQSKLQVFKTSNRGWGLRCINDVPRGSFICIYAGHLLTEQKANEGGLDAGDEYFAELDYIEVAEQIKEGYESDVVEPDEEEEMYNPDKDDDDDEFIAPGDPYRNKALVTRLSTRRSTKNSSDAEHDSQERQVISFEPNKSQERPSSATERPTMRRLFGKDEGTYIMDAKVTGNLGRYFNHSCSPNLFVQNVFVDTHDLRFPWVAFFAFSHIRAGTELTWNYNYEVGVVPGKVLYCQCGAPNCRQRLL